MKKKISFFHFRFPRGSAAYTIMLKVHWWTELSDGTTSGKVIHFVINI